MKRLALLVAVVGCPHTNLFAEFTGLTCEPYVGVGWLENEYDGLTTYRLYAEFDNPADLMLVVQGFHGPLTFEPSGGMFHNTEVPFASNTAPVDLCGAAGIWFNQWDTYVTIGTDTSAGDQTTLSAGFGDATENLGGYFSDDDIGWFVTPDAEQARPVDSRVLLAQMTVPCGDTVIGSFSIVVLIDGEGMDVKNLSFDCGPADFPDCNVNCLPDAFEIATGRSNDCDENGVPDKCDEEPCLRGDLNCSGDVGFDDILQILQSWGPCPGCVQDVDDDGEVGFQEILYVLGHWGPCAP